MFKHELGGRIQQFLLGTLLAVFAVVVNLLIQGVFGLLSFNSVSGVMVQALIHPLLSSLATGFFEEFIFRWLLLTVLMKLLSNNLISILIGSCLFAIAHLGNSHVTEIALLSHLMGGLVYSYAFVKTKEIWLPFGLHFGWNYSQIVLGIPMSGTNYYSIFNTTFYSPELLNGGLYGFEGGCLSFASRIVLFGVLFYIFKSKLFIKKEKSKGYGFL